MKLEDLKTGILYYKKNADMDGQPGELFLATEEKKRFSNYIDFYGICINNYYRDWTIDIINIIEWNVEYDYIKEASLKQHREAIDRIFRYRYDK